MMTKYIIHFFDTDIVLPISAPNAETAMKRAMEIYENVSHVEEV